MLNGDKLFSTYLGTKKEMLSWKTIRHAIACIIWIHCNAIDQLNLYLLKLSAGIGF